jgi:fermentation-respiration switch protein FrsA (DUF1100 family)
VNDLALCHVAQEAYTALPTWQFGDVQAILRWAAPKEPVVAFKGTSPTSLADWLRDLDAVPQIHPKLGMCHRGFLAGALQALEAIQAATKGCPVVLTGHSLGGALAALTGALMGAVGNPVAGVVTFGCPRVGFQGVRMALTGIRCARYVHGDDIVPTVPWPYEHHTAQPIALAGSADPIANHFISNYLEAMTNA